MEILVNSPQMSLTRVLFSDTHAEAETLLLLQFSSCFVPHSGLEGVVWVGSSSKAATRGINSCWERLGEP